MESPDVKQSASFVGALRTAFAGICLILSAGILILWVGSLNSKFELFNNVDKFELYSVESWKGKLQFCHSNNLGKTHQLNQWVFWTIPDTRLYNDYVQHAQEWEGRQFSIEWNTDNRSLAMPHGVWILIIGLFAYFLKPKPRWQFGFLDLVLLTAIIAVLLVTFATWS